MTLAEFKKAFGVGTLKFYRSHSSSRSVAAFGNNQLLVTTVDFDPAKPGFVYENPAEGADGSYILSNKEQRAADFTL